MVVRKRRPAPRQENNNGHYRLVFLARFVLGTMVNVFEIEDMGPYKGLPPLKAKENQHAASA